MLIYHLDQLQDNFQVLICAQPSICSITMCHECLGQNWKWYFQRLSLAPNVCSGLSLKEGASRGQEGGKGESSYLESFHWCPPAYVLALGRADALTLDSFMLLCISRRYCLDQWLCSRLCSEMIIVFDVGNLIFLNTCVAYPLLITFRRMK